MASSWWGRKGTDQKNAKLNEDKVLAIKQALADGARITDLATEFGVAKSTISDIKNGRLWSHVKLKPHEE